LFAISFRATIKTELNLKALIGRTVRTVMR